MTNFNWFKAIGFGIVIWAIMFGLVWAAIGFGIFGSVLTQIALAILAGVASYFFAYGAKPEGIGTALGYGSVFAIVGIILDLIITQQLVAGLFHMWTYYLTYGVMLLAPSLQWGAEGHFTSPRAI